MHTNILYFHNHNGMTKTKIKKVIAIASIAALSLTTMGSTFAANIGTASISGGATSNVVWDDSFPGTATGTVSDVVITAKVLPTLNMVISTGSIDLGTLLSGVESTGGLDIEVGTNAANGVTITARSGSGGLTNTTDGTTKIISTNAGESYTYASTAQAHDSSVTGFVQSSNYSAVEVVNNTTEHTIYSTNKPEKDDATNSDVTFTVAATTTAETAAGDYQDTVTFTVTGNF